MWHGQGGPNAISFFGRLKGLSAEEIIRMASKGAGESHSQLMKTEASKRFRGNAFSQMADQNLSLFT